MWMGGFPPLGYDVKDRKLVINDAEAEVVRWMFHRYVQLRSVNELRAALDREGYVSKIRVNSMGRRKGGKPFTRGGLYKMLNNRIYRGEIVHLDLHHPGEHDAIVEEPLWNEVQAVLEQKRVDRAAGNEAAQPSLLTGLIYDESGQRLTPTHAQRKGQRYRYYTSQKLTTTAKHLTPGGWRVPARDLEQLVWDRLASFLGSETELFAALENSIPDHRERQRFLQSAALVAREWQDVPHERRRVALNRVIGRIDLSTTTVVISIDMAAVRTVLAQGLAALHRESLQNTMSTAANGGLVTLTVSTQLKRAGVEMRFIVQGADCQARTAPDTSLHRLLAQAFRYRKILMDAPGASVTELAERAGLHRSLFTRALRLSFLAPDILDAILRDQHPLELTAERAAKHLPVPVSWFEQRIAFGLSG
jgi:hypothetical protein